MTEINIDLVKELRAQTGVSIMQCKKALEEAEGDIEKAKVALTKKSGEIAAKKGDRDLNSGVILTVTEGNKGAIFEIGCETDFVANNEDFQKTAGEVAQMIFGGTDKNADEVKEKLSEATQKFGERIEVVRIENKEGAFGTYVHNNKSVGAIVVFKAEDDSVFSKEGFEQMAKDVAMHIAAQHPKYLKKEDIDSHEMETATETLKEEVKDKPVEMQDKILEGKINAYFKERVLETQSFIKNPEITVKQLVENFGEGLEIVEFTRFGVAED
ncbi:translation elongation factor Ts [Candidatus Campbellbacteria bacterium]|nr:MAG: translation elongation factor Ts [Candidatus Campbellbacteria bacterium]